MKYRIALAPRTNPNTLILQADMHTWKEVVAALRLDGQSALARLIDGNLSSDWEDDVVVRVEFLQDHARSILRFAGLSA